MSNLWFFRLKKAEQQRRRSSGEQSVGSHHSLQSAAGLSASSLPAASAGGPSAPQRDQEASPDEAHEYANKLGGGGETYSLLGDGRASCGGVVLSGQQHYQEQGARPARFPGQPEVRQQEQHPLLGGALPGLAGQELEMPSRRTHVVPLVNIIRSDSVASGFCSGPAGSGECLLECAPVEQCQFEVAEREQEQEQVREQVQAPERTRQDARVRQEQMSAAKRNQSSCEEDGRKQLVCELADGGRRVECKTTTAAAAAAAAATATTTASPEACPESRQPASLGGGQFLASESVASLLSGLQQQQAAGAKHHQLLSSGKVPPIHEHLLDPNQSRVGGLAMADSMDNLAALIPRIRVEFYNSENTLKEKLQLYFIKDHTVSLYVRTAKLILKVLACYLYVCRVILDRGPAYANCYGCQSAQANNVTSASSSGGQSGSEQILSTTQMPNLVPTSNYYSQQQSLSKFDSHPYDGPINFKALFWVDRGPGIWGLQTTIAVICFMEAILMQYLTYKNSIFSVISFHFTLELVTNTPFILSIFLRDLRTLFVPGFLNCWLAKQCLEAMLNDISIVRQSSVFSHRLTILSATVFCLIFTSACGFQHTQRSGGRNFISIFESIYFVVVTFSTVGYGDFKPETWPSQLFIMVMICVALIVLPTQFEQLAYFWIERKKLGASYAHHSTRHEKHVVVCSTTLRADTIMDFLNEFYAHPLLQTFSVVLLSPCELDTTMKLVLQTPTWNNRVVYIQGSALKATDLIRARMQSAEACFILAARNYNDRSAADEHTILRSWAIRDFSPYVPQYVQIFRTENKIHVAFAEHVVCDDEFKYALLANNCLIPGTSTLVTLLLHTSSQQSRRRRRRNNRCQNIFSNFIKRGRLPAGDPVKRDACSSPSNAEGRREVEQDQDQEQDGYEDDNAPEWKRLYGKCSANEIYHIRLSDSRFFGEYQGKSFTYASFHSHRKFGVALIGVQTDMRGTWPIMLNPGPSYVLKSSDILFYINITKEENSTLMPMIHQNIVGQQQQMGLNNCGGGGLGCGLGSVEPPLSEASGMTAPGPLAESSATPSATYIRVEASSPTAGVSVEQQDGELLFHKQQQHHYHHMSLKKHSVADGASIVARSLCSIAGVPAGTATELLAGHDHDRPLELQHLTAKLLAKRNSSASTGAPTSASGHLMAGQGQGMGSRNASTLELATLAGGIRKGSNISITSTKSRDASPTRLKQVVSGLAVKMKRVKLGKSLTHLTIPRMDLGGGSSASSTESFVNARGRRPSIAPVPAMMGESEEHDSDHEREQESYFAMSWHSSSESSPIVKKFVFCTTYVGVSPTLCYMLQRKKSPCCLQLIQACEHCPYKNARQHNWPNRCIILASDFASNGIYNFLVPLRAHFHNPNELRPIVLLLERKPTPQFIDAISWFPMVYWMPGSIDCLDDLIKAGINLAHSVVVTNKESTNSAEEDYLADCNTIVAVQTMFKMFPSAGIITELSQSSNMRFMQFRAHDLLLGELAMANGSGGGHGQSQSRQPWSRHHSQSSAAGLDRGSQSAESTGAGSQGGLGAAGGGGGNIIRDRMQLRKLHSQYYNKTMGKEANSHAYKFRLPFAAGNVFSASMLDTLLYQAFVKDYMITMVRLLLGIDQAPGSGFLSSMRITKEDLWIRTYGRLYQRLCSTTCEIPLGIYRTEPLETHAGRLHLAPEASSSSPFSFGAFASQQASYEQATEELERIEISNMVKNRLQDLGMNVNDYEDSSANRNTFSYVIINPNCDVRLREGDIIYLIRPSPIHSRKLFMHRANSVRHAETNATTTATNVQAPQSAPLSAFMSANSGGRDSLPANPGQQQPRVARSRNGSAGASSNGQPTRYRGARDRPLEPTAKAGGPSGSTDQEKQMSSKNLHNNIDDNEQQPAAQSSSQLRSYYSDGDFSEVLIKVDEHDDSLIVAGCNSGYSTREQLHHQPGSRLDSDFQHDQAVGATGQDHGNSKIQRRRSSCSDAEASDSKRSSLARVSVASQQDDD